MIPLLSFFSGWQVKLVLVAALIFGAWMWHKAEVKIAVNEVVLQIQQESAKEGFKLKERSLNAQIALQESFNNIQKEKDAKIVSLNRRVRTLSNSLRDRPYRPEGSGISDSPRIEESKAGATGGGLYRNDAEFLARFSGMAEELKVELLACYKSYDEAKVKLDKFKTENNPKTN